MTRKEWRIIVIEAQRLAQNGHCIESIKLLREKAGCGLKDAHDANAQVARCTDDRSSAMSAPLAFRFPCPLCGAPLQVASVTTVREFHPGYHVRGEALPEHEVETTAALCTGCCFVLDLEHADRSARSVESLSNEIRLMIKEL